jgi:hypothetical protein
VDTGPDDIAETWKTVCDEQLGTLREALNKLCEHRVLKPCVLRLHGHLKLIENAWARRHPAWGIRGIAHCPRLSTPTPRHFPTLFTQSPTSSPLFLHTLQISRELPNTKDVLEARSLLACLHYPSEAAAFNISMERSVLGMNRHSKPTGVLQKRVKVA